MPVADRVCQHCKAELRLLAERTAHKESEVWVCDKCDGRLKLYARYAT